MKILLIGFAKIKYMPYLHFYLDHMRGNHEIHVVYWNRDKQKEDLSKYPDVIFHEFAEYQEDHVSPIFKIKNFRKFRKYVRALMRQTRYDFVICLHTFPCVLMARELKKYYQGKYIFDYRDSTYEKFPPFKRLIARLVRGSYATFVSSEGFRRFLPSDCEDKIHTSHNLLLDSLAYRDCRVKTPSKEGRLRIGFWGYIRHEELNREIIRKIALDRRFELHYYGKEQQVAQNLKVYASEIGADNVFFHGEYVPEDRYEFAKQTDLLHNVYQDANMMLAMANKFYDGLIFYIPQICMVGSAMGRAVERDGVGLTCDPSAPDFTDRLWVYYHGTDRELFYEQCDKALDRVLNEYYVGRTIIENAITNEK